LKRIAALEDTGAAFLDVDVMGLGDLMVGKAENQVGMRNCTNKLYNKIMGEGFWKASNQVLPSTFKNMALLPPEDFD